ncbi:MAG: sulfite exporter TauE/SafE family protein [Burkholderiaceae bacterium]
MALDDPILWFAIGAFLFAGTIKGVIGIGLPTASISLMAQVADPRVAIALLMVPMFVANTWQILRAGRLAHSIAVLWPFALAMCLFMGIGAQFAAGIDRRQMMLVTGCVILLFVATSFVRETPPIPSRLDRVAQLVLGAVAGLLGGLTAIWSPPMVIYLLARRVSKDDFIAFTGLLIFVGSFPLYLGYWHAGLLQQTLASASVLMVLPTLAGFALGESLRTRLGSAGFRRAVIIVFGLMGLNLVRRALLG